MECTTSMLYKRTISRGEYSRIDPFAESVFPFNLPLPRTARRRKTCNTLHADQRVSQRSDKVSP